MELLPNVSIHFVADWGEVEGMLAQLEAYQLYGIDSEWVDTASQRNWYACSPRLTNPSIYLCLVSH